MPGPTPVKGLDEPRLVPVPPVPVYQVNTAFVPATPLAVIVVVADAHIGLAAAVALVMLTLVLDATVQDVSAGLPQVPVTLAK